MSERNVIHENVHTKHSVFTSPSTHIIIIIITTMYIYRALINAMSAHITY